MREEVEGKDCIIQDIGGYNWTKRILTSNGIVQQIGAIFLNASKCEGEIFARVDGSGTTFSLHSFPVLTIQHLLHRRLRVQLDVHMSV